MSRTHSVPSKVLSSINSFKIALRKFFGNNERKRFQKECNYFGYYEEAKKAQTQERNLLKALEFYTKAIEKGQKKDSSIKDFASSLHQMGYTREAVKFMDDCELYYDGNKDKYFRLRDNLEIQIRPTGKHLCKYLLIENISREIKNLKTEEEIKTCLFKSPKRIKSIKILEDFQLINFTSSCTNQGSSNLLIQFESFSAAKKTLQSFYFDEWFGSDLYWVNSKDMRIVCSAVDGKNDFEQGFLINDELITHHLNYQKESFWTYFGERIYLNKESNGFINLLSTHLIKEHLSQNSRKRDNKENIFESSKINEMDQKKIYKQSGTYKKSLQPMKVKRNDSYSQNTYEEKQWAERRYNSYQQFYYY